MEKAIKEYRSWLRHNSSHLRDYTAYELARLAIAVGFPIEIVCHGTLDHLVHSKKIIQFWDSPFATKWVSLMMYENGKED